MSGRIRIEAHYSDGRVEFLKDRREAQELVDTQPPGTVRVWMVWWNDLGIAHEVRRSLPAQERVRATV